LGPDGYPLSWRHFQYGLARLGRSDAQHDIRLANAVTAAHAQKQDAKDWFRKQRMAAGWD
jgi:hypothetical protein